MGMQANQYHLEDLERIDHQADLDRWKMMKLRFNYLKCDQKVRIGQSTARQIVQSEESHNTLRKWYQRVYVSMVSLCSAWGWTLSLKTRVM